MNIRILHYVGHQTFLVAQILFVLFFSQLFLFDIGKVDGTSMEPTLVDQQLFLVNRFELLFRQPKRFEIIQLYHPLKEQDLIVKRVIGLPGEEINIQSDKIIITNKNGEEMVLSEPYLPQNSHTIIRPGWSSRFVIPEHSYFILGDNRAFSSDSRLFGSIPRKYIAGTVYFFPQ